MNELMSKTTKEVTITTLEIAEMMETPHYEILRKLEGTTNADGSTKQIGIIPVLTDRKIPVSDYFSLSAYKDASGKENRCYNVTKLGCDFLANKFTGEKGILFTAKYVKRFYEMERNISEGKLETKEVPTLTQATEAAKLIKETYEQAGVDARYIAVSVNTIYKEVVVDLPLGIETKDTKLYDQTMIARELGIMSVSGKPHRQAVGAIINMLNIFDEDKISTPYINHGHSGVSVQYKSSVLDGVKRWIEDNSYPQIIKSGNKNLKVKYM